MKQGLCQVCRQNKDIDENFPLHQYIPAKGICAECALIAADMRFYIYNIRSTFNPVWLNQHKDEIIKALFGSGSDEQ